AETVLHAADPAAHLDVAHGVEEGENAQLGDPLLAGLHGRREVLRLGRGAAEKGDGHGRAPRVDDVDRETLHRLGAQPGRLAGRAQVGAEVDADDTLARPAELRVDAGEIARAGRAGGGQL